MLDDLFPETDADKALQNAIRTEQAPPDAPEPEKVPEPEKAPEPEVKASDAPPLTPPEPKADKPARLVPIDSLHEERQRRQALERRIAELEAKNAPPQEEIDELKDPIAAIGKLKGEIAQFKDWQRQQAEEATLGAQIASRVTSYARENPDYIDQYKFLQASRVNELRALGQDDASIMRQIRAEEMDLGRIALSQDKDPGEIISNLAKARGWQKAGPVTTPNEPAPSPAAAEAAREAAEKRVDQLERGRRAAISSSGSGGRAAASGELSVEEIVNLDGAAFDKAAAKWIQNEKAAGRWF